MRTLIFFLLGFLMVMTSCLGGGNDKAQEEVNTKEDNSLTIGDGDSKVTIDSKELDEAMNKIKDAFSAKNENGESMEVVDFRELKKLMPKRIGGLKQTSSSGEKTGMLGFKFSVAEAEYVEGDQRMDVSITDVAGIGMLTVSMAAWTNLDMDKETDNGYERTTQILGYPAFEKYDKQQQGGQISLFVDDRYIVNIEGRNVSEKDLRRAVDALDLKSLGKL